MSSFLPLEPERILEIVGMFRELGTKSVKLAWSDFTSLSISSGWKEKIMKFSMINAVLGCQSSIIAG